MRITSENNSKARRLGLLATTLLGGSIGSIATAQETAGLIPRQEVSGEAVGVPAPETGGEIIVTGSRIARSGFTTPTPVTVLGQDRLEDLAATSIGDALAELPGFRALSSPSTSGITLGAVGSRFADLRALGAVRTLVLLDGRRFVPSNVEGTVNLNVLPALLLERTEVVTGGASAAYGSDAVAGVVNLMLDRNLTGIRATAQYGQSERGDNEDFLLSLAAGTPFAADRGHVVVGAEYNENRGVGDCYTREWCAIEVSTITNPTPGANGLPALIITDDAHGASLTRSGLIVGPGPLRGIQFNPDGTTSPFQFGQFATPSALFMVGGDEASSGPNRHPYYAGPYLKVPVTTLSLFGHLDFEFSDALQFDLDLSYGNVESRSIGAQSRDTNLRIQRDNPFVPASIAAIMDANAITSFTFGRAGFDLGFAQALATTETFRIAPGISGRIGDNWTWNAYYQYGKTDYTLQVDNNRIEARFRNQVDATTGPGGTPVCRINVDANPDNDDPACAPINLFGENMFSAAAKAYSYGTSRQDTEITQQVAAANIQGKLFQNWAGPVSIAAGVELRWDEVDGTADPISEALGWYVGNGQVISGTSDVTEGYFETVVPLLRDAPLARSLELNAAIRFTNYKMAGRGTTNSFDATTWKVGLVYDPVDALRFRVTRSRDIRAPNINELYSTATVTFFPVIDTAGTNATALVPVFRGGNPALQPEAADTWTAGIVFSPPWPPFDRLRLSVDYFNITVDNAIDRPGAQTVIDGCRDGSAEYCAMLTRAPGGLLTGVTAPLLNINQLKTSGVDFEAAYNVPLGSGDLSLRALATFVDEFITISPTGRVDRAGQVGWNIGSSAGVPDWVVDLTATYRAGPFSGTLQMHYIDSGIIEPTRVGPEQKGYDPTLPNSVNRNTVPSRAYFNFNTSYTLVDRGKTQVELFGAVRNLFDQDPPVIHTQNGATNQIFYDPIGRDFRVGVRFRM
jgi:outer membrane receptor protein involved in Fe transport